MSKRFYVTTAIDYVNGEPHLGHAYEKIIADVIARARRSLVGEVFFLTGLDEHGQKVQQAAQARGVETQAYCDEFAGVWKSFAAALELSIDDFVRTSEPRHKEVVQAILSRLHANGFFYKASYEGYYSAKEETFLTEKDRLPDGNFPTHYGEVAKLVEDNYYFKMEDQQAWLIDYIDDNPGFIQPDTRRNEILGFLRNNVLDDLCITRPANRLAWGIPLPFDPAFVTYVWFDALVNYISIPAAHGDPLVRTAFDAQPSTLTPQLSLWPADIHVIGKDIVKFHGVYWPIMLKAMGLPQPKQILVHGWWQKEGEKLSKSTGHVVDPIAIIKEWGLDAFRFYVVRELAIGPDGNWTDAGFESRYESELAKKLGNLLNRSLSMLNRYRAGVVPARSDELAPEAARIVAETRALLEDNQLQAALVSIWSLVNLANKYIDDTAPFKIAKDPTQAKRLDEVLFNLVEICRILAVLLWPFLPGTAVRIYAQLGLKESPARFNETRWGVLAPGHKVNDPVPLFPIKEKPKAPGQPA
ncbi:MAG TPA: class I tRNA ligase family protein [Verrucomicrobiae bacterium]|jgi:methionyl-tRNA synthetase|nr:class I tRNA ligase family protein [Verrucomicrobiae bacterium]